MDTLARTSFAAALSVLLAWPTASQAKPFITFESGSVRPLAMSPDALHLFVANTPDNRLEIFTINDQGLIHTDTVAVGMEPVAVAARSDDEVWVVNHLSDSVSVVSESSGGVWRVTRTLLVGDEPRDIVFDDPDNEGPEGVRAFVTTAHRGQHRTHASIELVPGAGDPQLTAPSVGRADVWVFDATDLGASIGGTPLEIIELFGDTPRALAVDPVANKVYAAVFHSGNQTTVVAEGMVCDGFASAGPCSGDGVQSPNGLPGGDLPGGNPGPSTNVEGEDAPEVALIVKYDEASGEWRDESGRNWSNGVRFDLPDYDVFAIDANTLNEVDSFAHVGTILFNMAVNPSNGNVYVSNTDAQNLTRFEGSGGFAPSTVQGNLARSRITVLTGTDAKARHLNRHIDYSILKAPAGTGDHSLATPIGMAVSGDGTKLYLAAFGSSKIGVFDTADLENDSLWATPGTGFDPTVESANYISVSGGGPSGLMLDEARNRLYVTTRFNNGVSIVDLGNGTERANLVLHNPEPEHVVEGRHMLYDAFKTSSNGEASCASCHVFADFDSLAWDLGNPDALVSFNPQPINAEVLIPFAPVLPVNGTGVVRDFSPMKGPMTTQTLRGMVNSGHMHWRGDRSNGYFGIDDPHTGDSDLSFKNFIVAFEGLLGMDVDLSGGLGTAPEFEADMQKFSDFALDIVLPPNPVRALDNSLTPEAQAGKDFAEGDRRSDGLPASFDSVLGAQAGFRCEGCHRLDPSQGFFGTGGDASFDAEQQILKVPHLRNLYQKVGMFGMPNVPFNNPIDSSHQGDQVRGTGFLHDGTTDTLFRFFQATAFNEDALGFSPVGFTGGDAQRRQMEQYMLAFESDLAPIVGQQVTLDGSMEADTLTRIALMEARAATGFTSAVLGGAATECDLVVKGFVGYRERGYLYQPGSGDYRSDRAAEAPLSPTALQGLAGGTLQELTYTCAPPGSGTRMAIDRDLDGFLDSDEIDAGTDPANFASFVGACSNGTDDDGDGLADLLDPGCRNSSWNVENPECNDGGDNEGDGLIDLLDPQCSAAWDRYEKVQRAGCGIGVELVIGLPLLLWLRRRGSRPCGD